MRVRIRTAPIGPLTVLPGLPNARLSMVEGLNGIGKTLAVRLLQACVGDQPYPRGSASWRSLCEGLGEFEVEITDLHHAKRLLWAGDTRDWRTLDADAPLTFGQCLIDDQPADQRRVRALLSVHRIAGDEDIVDTLANQAVEEADRIGRWSRQVAGAELGPLRALEDYVDAALSTLGEWSTARFELSRKQLASAEASVRDRAQQLQRMSERKAQLAEAKTLHDRLARMQQQAPGLAQRLATIDQQLSEARARHEGAQQQVAQLAAKVAGAAGFVRELDLARKNLGRNTEKLRRATEKASAIATPLSLPLQRSTATSRITILRAELAELDAQRQAFDAAPTMRLFLDGLVTQLSSADERGLGDQIALEDVETGLELTVNQTRQGMATRRRVLEGQPPPPEAQRIARDLDAIRRHLQRVEELVSALEDIERYRRLVEQAEQRMDAALAATDRKAAVRLQQADAQRRAEEEVLLSLAADRAGVVQQLGGESSRTIEAVQQQARAALTAAAVDDPDDLDRLLTACQTEHAAAAHAAEAAREEQQRARREAARADADVKRVLMTVAANPELHILLAGVSGGSDLGQLDTHVGLAQLDSWRQILTVVQDRLGDHRIQLAAVEEALRAIARQLHGEDLQAARYVPQLQAWFERLYSDWFSSPRIRHELLPEAIGRVRVDLSSGQVLWEEATGAKARPLEAFSSGEKAFAYTRARLGWLDDEEPRPANRLIVLDEFGAFIAHDRFGALLAYLRDRATTHPEDQVVVILPLNRDYGQLAENAIGPDATRLHALAEQVRQQRYAVQVLES